MNRIRHFVISATVALFFCISIPAAMAKETPKNIGNAARVLKDITAIKKDRIPPSLLKNAIGVAIFPGASKADFMVSGKSVSGVLMAHDMDGKWSDPVFVTMSGGTLGWQMVGEPMDIILIFKNGERFDAIVKDKLYMDFKVKVMPGPVGKITKDVAEEDKKVEISSYVRCRGAFVDVSVAASTLKIDGAANDAFYGKPKINPRDILAGKLENTPNDVKDLKKLLTEYSAGK
jgi:lipid-binding SYLF domain-containing protein